MSNDNYPADMGMNEIEPQLALVLPLAAPARPVLLRNTTSRIAFIAPEGDAHIEALELVTDGDIIAGIGARLRTGRVEIALTDGFGKSRTLQLSPAEAFLLYNQLERFLQELPQ